MSLIRTISLGGIILSSALLSACQKNNSPELSSNTHPATVEKVVIGFQKSSVNLLVSRQEQLFEQQFPQAQIEWKEFPAGPQMLEALAVGAVDYGYVGNTPPIFAQAANKPLTYVGYEAYSGKSLALVTQHNSPIQTIEQLKGKRIALQKGSNAHEFLAKVLQKSGLTWQDIQPIWLPPADARAAFDKQSIDAWAIWDPFLSSAEQHAQARVLINAEAFAPTYSFFIGNPEFIAQHPDANQKFIEGLNQADQWIIQHPTETEQLYAKYTGLPVDIAKTVLSRRFKPSPVAAPTEQVIKSQQQIADLFYQEELLPNQINVQSNVWTAK